MSMTRAEAIERLEKLIALYEMASTENKMIDYSGMIDALKFSLSALRPVSRERVEKVWRGEWITKHYVDGILEGTNFDECSKCGYQRVFENPELKTKYIFCPNCGTPMTAEAVQMVMERLEALHETVE